MSGVDVDKNDSNLPDLFEEEPNAFKPLSESFSLSTETIDLNRLYSRDVTESGSFDLRRLEATSFGRLLEAIPIPALVVDASGIIAFVNKALAKISPAYGALVGIGFATIFSGPSVAMKSRSVLNQVLESRKPLSAQGHFRINRTHLWGRMHFRSVRLGTERSVLVLVEDLSLERKQVQLMQKHAQELREARDQLDLKVNERTAELLLANEQLRREIVDRRNAESNLNLAANVIKSSNEAIVITDAAANIVDVNDAFCEVTGYSRGDVIGKNPRIMASGRHDSVFWQDVWKMLKTTGQWKGEIWDRRRNGEIFPKLLSLSAVTDDQGQLANFVGIFSDISKMKQTEERLQFLAHHDPLTRLANRVLFRDRLDQAITMAERTGERVAVLFLDLDGFKTINDTLGHPVGDQMLATVAQRLTGAVRAKDTVARMGGDEFTLVLSEFSGLRSIEFLSRKIIARLSEPYELAHRTVFITATIGIALYPDDGKNADRLLQNADTAMYHAKAQGKNRFAYFSQELNRNALERLELETALREAIRREEFVLYYQPQVDLATRRVVGCEALIRWNHPTKGLISPMRFIDLAEETGLIMPMGEWVMRNACEQARLWRKQGLPRLRVAVNLSGSQVTGDEIVRKVYQIISETDMDAAQLDLEITESTLMKDNDAAVEILRDLKRLGVSLSIDDFGTGYSSLSQLKRFPVDKLKIDQSFVRNLGKDPDDEAIVGAIIAIGHNMKLKVVAEGVENREQLALVQAGGCDEVQGYYFSRPVPPDEFAQFVRGGLGSF
jgi:diguanylate cyclase (GGDEF)-like protein/PAS domain S-box-containing protein